MKIFLAVFLFFMTTTSAFSEGGVMVVAGNERGFDVHIPEGASDAPALFVLHGQYVRDMDNFRRRIGFDRLADEFGFVVIYPRPYEGQWNDGRMNQWGRLLHKAGDLTFFEEIVDRLESEGVVDEDEVYFVGHAGGGRMALSVTCRAPDMINAVAVVKAGQQFDRYCDTDASIPALFVHGTEDGFVPFWGEATRTQGWELRNQVMPARETMEFWSEKNGCREAGGSTLLTSGADSRIQVRITGYKGCRRPLVHIVEGGAGHAWPGSEVVPRYRSIMGRVAPGYDLARRIWSFFQGVPLLASE